MKYLATYLLALIAHSLYATGVRDTVVLDEVVKVEQVSGDVHSYESPFIDVKYKQGQRLSDALGEYSSVYIKNYGSGGLASLAIRGTSATQTGIEWNGVKLNSPSLGQVDLALFTLGMQDELQLVRTGYRGNIGGTLRMNNELRLDSGFSIGAVFRAGSFGTYDALVDARYAKGRVSGSSKFSYLTSQNNFLYRNTYQEGSPYVRQTNAAVNQVSFLQQLNIKLNQRNQLAFYIWLTDANRQLPPVMSQPAGKEQQDDYSLRLMANWKAQYNQLKLRFTSAYIEDKMRYRNPLLALDETSVTHAMRNTLGASYLFPFSLSVNGELNYDLEQAVINAYGCPRMRNAGGVKVYADYYMANGLRFHAGFRQDLVDKKLSAFSPEAAVNYLKQLNNAHQLSAGFVVSRNFRFPTLNDLYWTPGGNPALKEEKSVNGELQFKYGYKKVFSVSVSDFYVYVDNWIQWIPQGSFWMPVNFRRVFSRGAEAAVHLTNADGTHRRRLNVHFNASYTFTKTTNLDAASQFDQSKGMQLIYVPYHSLTAGLQLEFMGLYVRSVNRYTGSVFTSTDNTQSLPGYFVADLEVGKDFSLKDVDFGFSFRVNNIGNAQYQVVLQRPMPGRNFEGTLRFKFYR